ncbi:MAG: choice-of-anchor J domain-containing protein [Bacteroidetes bacterium]|nr:choice-of-anchor J domain-containing protein [Bacteroidota bacterium]
MKNLIKFFLPVLLLGLVFNACIEEDFDQPPVDGTDPGLTANATIKQLKDLHTLGQLETIEEDWIIKATVVADDASGNWYQSFVIQDSTGGITVLIETTDSYTLFPVGREVYVKCKGLVLGDYNNLIQLGGFILEDGSLGNIINVTNHLIRGKKVNNPNVKIKTISELTLDDVSTLITLLQVQFVTSDTARTYADPVTRTSYNRYLESCHLDHLIVRTSGYANFAGTSLPNGGGSLKGVLSIFGGDLQFLVRDLNDVHMGGERCMFDPCAGTTITTVTSLNQDFESGVNNDAVAITGWTNIAVQGTRTWQFKEFSSDVYCQATAYNDSSPQMETWLVTPQIDLDGPKVLNFESAKAFWTHNGLSVWLSTDFVCDPTAATWQPLSCTLAGQSDADHAWIPSGDIELAALTGQKVFIGFKYVGSGTGGQTTSYRIDRVKIFNE